MFEKDWIELGHYLACFAKFLLRRKSYDKNKKIIILLILEFK